MFSYPGSLFAHILWCSLMQTKCTNSADWVPVPVLPLTSHVLPVRGCASSYLSSLLCKVLPTPRAPTRVERANPRVQCLANPWKASAPQNWTSLLGEPWAATLHGGKPRPSSSPTHHSAYSPLGLSRPCTVASATLSSAAVSGACCCPALLHNWPGRVLLKMHFLWFLN